MQVEVIVQDFFYESSLSEVSDLELYQFYTASPITAETWETWFHRWLEFLEPNISSVPIYEISLRLTNDADIQALNSQYRHQNRPTDVLAFAALEVDCPQPDQMQSSLPLYLGDIVISVDTAYQQAEQHGHSLQTELAWLASHALLHLLGWDHPDEDSLIRMLNQQSILLQNVDIAIKNIQTLEPIN